MFLTSLELHNFGQFYNARLPIRNKITVLAGHGGSGKSTFLKAAAISLSAYVQVFDKNSRLIITEEDVHEEYSGKGSVIEARRQFPVVISAFGEYDGKGMFWSCFRDGERNSANMKFDGEMLSYARKCADNLKTECDSFKLPVMAYYSKGRQEKAEKSGRTQQSHKNMFREKLGKTAVPYEMSTIMQESHRVLGYHDCMSGILNEERMNIIFRYMEDLQASSGSRIPVYSMVKRTMEKAFAKVSGYYGVKVLYDRDMKKAAIIYRNEKGCYVKALLSRLGDGYRSLLYLAGDIACRMALLNPYLEDDCALETPGIVLIDDVDLYLEPICQQRILPVLTEIFPKVQLIVSAHGMDVINSVKKSSVIFMERDII